MTTRDYRIPQIVWDPNEGRLTQVIPGTPPSGGWSGGSTPQGPGLGNGVPKLGVVPRSFTRPAATCAASPDISQYAIGGKPTYDGGGHLISTEAWHTGGMIVSNGGVGVVITGGTNVSNCFYPFGANNSALILTNPSNGGGNHQQSLVFALGGTATSFYLGQAGSYNQLSWSNGQLYANSGAFFITPLGNNLWQVCFNVTDSGSGPVVLYTDGGSLDIAVAPYAAPTTNLKTDYDAIWPIENIARYGPGYGSTGLNIQFATGPDGNQSAYLISGSTTIANAFRPLGLDGSLNPLTYTASVGTPYVWEYLIKSYEDGSIEYRVSDGSDVEQFSVSVPFTAGVAGTPTISGTATATLTSQGGGWYILHVATTTNGPANPIIKIFATGGATNKFYFAGVQYGAYSFASPAPGTGAIVGGAPSGVSGYATTLPIQTLTFAYSLDNAVSWMQPRPGTYRSMLPTGKINSWIQTDEHMLQAVVRWIEPYAGLSLGPVATVWNGTWGWDSFLRWARTGARFKFYPDATDSTTWQYAYLVDPRADGVTLDDDKTRTVTLVLRSDNEFVGY